jgi:membrane associated rhomboid family serine protease
MRSNGPITMTFPPFRGVTRQVLIAAIVVFLAGAVLSFIAPGLSSTVINLLMLHPDQALRGVIWQFFTYSFVSLDLLELLFAALSFWFFGSQLEDEQGSRWFAEYFFFSTVGGALVASVLAKISAGRVLGIDVTGRASSLWPAVLALLLAFARFHAEEELRFNFIFRLKAKYLAAIYLLFYLASALVGGDRFGALTAVCVALSGYGFLQFAPRRGLRFAASERWFSLRNAFYRSKRQRAAKKFKVYMGKQGKDVSIDSEGRYVDPSGVPRDPNDKRWMN